MRLRIMLLAIVLAAPAVSAAAYESHGVEAYQRIYSDGGGYFVHQDGSITIGNADAQRAPEIALLNDYNARRRNGTMEGEADGGSGLGGNAGGVGSR